MRSVTRASLIALLLFTAACTRGTNAQAGTAQPAPVRQHDVEAYSAVKVTRDVTFATPDGIALKLDVYQPQPLPQDRLLPAVIYFHGGGWRSGDKHGGRVYLDALARRGFVGFTANYRLSGQAKFPAQLDDARVAVQWVKQHAAEYGGDAARIGVFGTSAGAHLAALLGTTVDQPDGVKVQAVADWYGPADLRDSSAWPRASRGMITQLIGGAPEQVPELVRQASPVAFVNSGDPPFLVIHGSADKTVPIAQSRSLAVALKQAGVKVQLMEVPGGGHGDFGRVETNKLIEAMAQFFHANL